ncbi:hypothetical protein PF005_g9885 [Phytophthora fragariae]|uniref:Uncharacterized protein n=1 Tax=Phytophthora fragariae TaxID=53985 RepID=A0A6A3FIJ3_9STRA|nr:hypothetical protein PF003_g29435 [Phytophthora fragariae]KAE8944963.1 hypothetical protein PF009_g5373 [Phytophthora fragariae]KAE9115914.1 hypothetical protein PF007_g9847 [Phytophthora fragariae]KAE9119100.1 hypothetical protein PF010_g7980 [Phytophthora fragariae]KAE9151479.1 hypothetical protein PF006_g4229 [Phytophthora fragariae]
MGRSKTKKKNGAGAKLSDGKGLATRLEEVESRSSQILRAQAPAQQGDVLLKDVLRGNGEKHLYDKILKLAVHADDDPPLIFGWKFVHEFVQAIHDANNQAAGGGAAVPPCPFPLPDPLTRESLLASVDAPYRRRRRRRKRAARCQRIRAQGSHGYVEACSRSDSQRRRWQRPVEQ